MGGNGVQWDLDGGHSDLDDAVTGEGVAPFFQPIVSLPSGTTVGFEALARWPRQPQLGPQEVFAYAAATQQVTELDRVCIDRSIDAALRGGLQRGRASRGELRAGERLHRSRRQRDSSSADTTSSR